MLLKRIYINSSLIKIKILNYNLLVLICFNCFSCQDKYNDINLIIDVKNIPINMTYKNENSLDSIFRPYKDSLDKIMNIVLCQSPIFLEKSRPESALSNWIADVCFNALSTSHKVDFCLLNYGGIRSSLPKGNICVKNIYELMPFDNELVIIEIPINVFDNLLIYLQKSGGHPISGIKINIKNTLTYHSLKIDSSVRVLTSDYLANGGDKMYFFGDSISCKKTQLKIRDILLEYCKEIDTINALIDNRFTYE